MDIYDRKPYLITIVVLVLLVLGLGGFLVYDKFIVDKTAQDKETMIDDVSLDLNVLYQIGDTLDRFDIAFNKTNSTYFEYLYKNKKLDAKNFDSGAALYASIRKDLIISNTNQKVLGGKVKNNMKKMFGTAVTYNANSINAGETFKISYDAATNAYTYTIPLTANDRIPEYISQTTKTRVEKEKIVVTRKIFYVTYNGNKATIYKSSNKQRLGEVTLRNDEVSPDEVVAKFGSRMNTYDYTFIENKSTDYTFSKIEKIR